MEPKKDVSTAILDHKKAPNKLMVSHILIQVEEALNRDCRELFLTGKEKVSTMRIALDDDKVHFHFSLDALRAVIASFWLE